MLSKFVKIHELSDGNFAIFNSLILDILIVDKTTKDLILNNKIEDSSMKEELYKSKIYIKSSAEDENLKNELISIFKDNIGIIRVMYLFVTDDCNLRCKYCFIENNPNCKNKRMMMTPEVAKLAIDKYEEHLLKHNVDCDATIMFYGGEPTLNFDLIKDIVLYVETKKVNFDFGLITNGTVLTEKMIDFFEEHKVSIGISIDGPKDVTDLNRKFRNSNLGVFDKVWETKKLLDSKGSEYAISMVTTDYFIENKSVILNWVMNNFTQPVFYNLLHYSEPNNNADAFAEKLSNFMIESFEKITNDNVYDLRIQRQINSFANKDFMFSDCAAIGARQITVMPDGKLTICHADTNNGNRHIGNIFEFCFDDILKTSEGKFYSERYTLLNEKCLNCEYIFCCGGGCPNHSGILFGNRNAIESPFCIYVSKIFSWMLQKNYDSMREEMEVMNNEKNGQ